MTGFVIRTGDRTGYFDRFLSDEESNWYLQRAHAAVFRDVIAARLVADRLNETNPHLSCEVVPA